MSKYVIDSSTLTGIADAIREKTCTAESIKTTDMARKIRGIGEKFITDASVAAVKIVPENALSYAKVTRIGSIQNPDQGLGPNPVREIWFNGYPVLKIPEAVQAIEGNGIGISAAFHNYIDLENKTFVKCVEEVDLGTLEWMYDSHSPTWIASLPTRLYAEESAIDSILVPYGSRYSVVSAEEEALPGDPVGDKLIFRFISALYIKDSEYTDVSSFTASLQGVKVWMGVGAGYREEPLDISDLWQGNNIFKVKPQGQINIRSSKLHVDQPNTIVYQVLA